MKIGTAIKFLRELKDMTQDEVAEKLHMTTNGYRQIENNISNPNLPKIEKIAKVFDMTTLEFLDFCENGATFYINGVDNNSSNSNNNNHYYICGKSGHEILLSELDKAKLTIQHQSELIQQQKREIENLNKLIDLLQQNSEKQI